MSVGTTFVGIWTLHDQYRIEESRIEAETRDRAVQAAQVVALQIDFYQDLLNALASKSELRNALEFGDIDDIQAWSQNVRSILPSIVGSALADIHGEVIGDPLEQRVGPGCQADLRLFSRGKSFEYPPIHREREGLEHFDITAHVKDDFGDSLGIVFISFHFTVLDEALERISGTNEKWQLKKSTGETFAAKDDLKTDKIISYEVPVPNSTWKLQLTRPDTTSFDMLTRIIILDLLILAMGGAAIALLLKYVLTLFRRDMAQVEQSLHDILTDDYEHVDKAANLYETGHLLESMHSIAHSLHEEKTQLKRETLTDPLTGLNNRRYFDLMLEHEFERSKRNSPAVLVIVDLNEFKTVNDTLGHQEGDRLLADVSAFLKETIRASDSVMRLGGDEFALILYNMSYSYLDYWLGNLAARFDAHVASSSYIPKDIACSFSLGGAMISASTYPNHNEVFDSADRAMYEAKIKGGKLSRFQIHQVDEGTGKAVSF